jgi:hypothetical protein
MHFLTKEKEKWNATKYRNLYRALLLKHEGVLKENKDIEHLQDYHEESIMLRNLFIAERNAWVMGITVGLAAFVSIRFLPRYCISRFGGAEKLKRLEEAEERSRQNKTKWVQDAFGTAVGASLSFWAGVRAYQVAGQTSESTFEGISQIPLVRGRSLVAEKVCPEWVQITRRDIPQVFWDNLDDANSLQDERTWHAIRTFSQNCIRRKLYERALAKDHPGEILSLPERVPDYVPSDQQLTTEQILHLILDR